MTKVADAKHYRVRRLTGSAATGGKKADKQECLLLKLGKLFLFLPKTKQIYISTNVRASRDAYTVDMGSWCLRQCLSATDNVRMYFNGIPATSLRHYSF